ncbi:vacuolar iron transporter homolog 2-like [Prosopis cineraria]|uniref:vacuolar iron transporter homolog 2-like n=1 Tax=Prosopis cineraria TaxID=364024 RepID=UPI00240F13D8|nr:vacuolar iron transporter homolog 2-like [Prosopis cineraria]XP_054792909.1 vacuolar iron transporter homolog 2-like [Prosopis cineraria]
MAAILPCGLVSLNHVGVAPSPIQPNYEDDHEQTTQTPKEETGERDYSQRGQWLRAAILGANDGLLSVAALMMGVGAVKTEAKAMVLSGFAGAVAGACSMAIGEFVSVYTQYDVEVAQMKREMSEDDEEKQMEKIKDVKLPNPFQAAFASALSFSVGALIPLLAAAFISDYKIRLMVVVAVASLALIMFGYVGAVLGKAPILRSCVRVVCGGLIAMGITFGLTKLLGCRGLQLYE